MIALKNKLPLLQYKLPYRLNERLGEESPVIAEHHAL
jgi:hypothetical protein